MTVPDTFPLGTGGALVRMPPREHGAATLRRHLEAVGITRATLFAADATRTTITFHELRATGITWRTVRGDEPLKIQRSAGHSDLTTTQRYIREATVFADGFREVFPVLPRSLVTDGPPDPDRGPGEGGDDPSSKPPPTSTRAARSPWRNTTALGSAGVHQGTEGGVLRESLPFAACRRARDPRGPRRRAPVHGADASAVQRAVVAAAHEPAGGGADAHGGSRAGAAVGTIRARHVGRRNRDVVRRAARGPRGPRAAVDSPLALCAKADMFYSA